MTQRAVNALMARIRDGAFKPGAGFEFPHYVSQGAVAGIEDRAARNAYRAEARRLEQTEFKREALAAVGLTAHPKADAAWDKAWELGHNDGLATVLLELQELAELML